MNSRLILVLAITMSGPTSITGVLGREALQTTFHHHSERSFYWDAKDLLRRLQLAERGTGPALTPSEDIDAHDGMAFVMGIEDVLR